MKRTDVLSLAWSGVIGKDQQCRCHQQHDAHYGKSRPEYLLHLVLEEQAHDTYGYHGYQYVDGISGLGIE